MRMSFFSLLLCMLFVTPSAAGGDSPELRLPGPGGNPGSYDRAVLWLDNPDFDANSVSSELIPEIGIESEVAGDFLLDEDVTIRRVTWWGSYWCGYEGVQFASSFSLRFYDDTRCMPESEPLVEYIVDGNANETLAEGGDMYSQFVCTQCVCVPLTAGLYWFSAQVGNHDFPPQWGRIGADMVQQCDSAFRSAYFGYPEWVYCTEIFGDPYDASQMFEDECDATATESTSWGAVRSLFR